MKDTRLLTADEVAKFFRVSRTTVYRWVQCRMIPFYKLGNELRFSEKDVTDFLDKARIGDEGFIKEPSYQPPRDIHAKKKAGYLTIEEVAKLFDTTTQRVAQMLQSGMIGSIKISGRRLFHEPDTRSFLKEQMLKPENERFYLNKNKAHVKRH